SDPNTLPASSGTLRPGASTLRTGPGALRPGPSSLRTGHSALGGSPGTLPTGSRTACTLRASIAGHRGIARRTPGRPLLAHRAYEVPSGDRPALGDVDLLDHTTHRGRHVHRRLLGLESDERGFRLDLLTGFDEHIDDGNVLEVAHVGHSY